METNARPEDAHRRVPRLLVVYLGLAAAGLFVSLNLEWIHLRLFTDPSYEAFCRSGTAFDCEKVALSRFSVFLGVPLSVWGVLGYLWSGAIGIAAIWGVIHGRTTALVATALLSCAMGTLALLLLAVSAVTLRAVCQLCLASHVITLAMAVTAIIATVKAGCGTNPIAWTRAFVRGVWKERMVAAVWCVVGVGTVVAPLVLVPSYWEISSFRTIDLDTGVSEEGLPWIGASRPKLVIHEFFDYECPFCRSAHVKLRRMLEKHPQTIRIVRHDTSRVDCPQNKEPKEYIDACRTVRGAYCAARQGRFWQWNDAAVLRPRPAPGPERTHYEEDLAKSIGLESAAFSSCLDSPQAFVYARERGTEAKRARAFQLPTHVVDGKKVTLKDIENRL